MSWHGTVQSPATHIRPSTHAFPPVEHGSENIPAGSSSSPPQDAKPRVLTATSASPKSQRIRPRFPLMALLCVAAA